MRKSFTLAAVATAALIAGCGKTDIRGMYEVTHHTHNQDSCTAEGQSLDDPPYFYIEKDDFFGQTFYAYSECTSPSPEDCFGGGLFGLSFSQSISDGWKGVVSRATRVNGTCYLGWRESTAVMQENGTVRIEDRLWQEETELPADDCTTDEARSRGTAMPCEYFTVIVGQLLEE